MIYITVKGSPRYHQITFDEYLFGDRDLKSLTAPNDTGTVTYEREQVSWRFAQHFDWNVFTDALKHFLYETESLRRVERNSLYREFYIPKKSGGLRKIDAPNEELSDALRRLKLILSSTAFETYHTAAFAYVEGRSTVDAVKRHQKNESNWFAKFDLHDFFGSTTPEFLTSMLSKIYPYSEVMAPIDEGTRLMKAALDLCFKDGGLPQGTPISPFLTNLMMIPIDYTLSNFFAKKDMVYTRYADDFIISSKNPFRFKEIEELIALVLSDFGAPFTLNTKKTRYGSRAGSNWNLGVMLNKDNEITVGHQKKKQFQNMLHSYAMDKKNGIKWPESDIRTMDGLRSYYKMVEGDTIDRIVKHVSDKTGVNIPAEIRADLIPV